MKRINRRILPIPILLAVFLLLSGCGRTETTSTPPPAEVPTSEPKPATIEPSQTLPQVTTTVVVTQAAPTEAETLQPSPQPQKVTAFPAKDSLILREIVSGLNRPTGFIDPQDGSGRYLILEQGGVVRVVQDGKLLDQPFMDLRDRVGPSTGERGLLGMDVEPGFASNGVFYVNYTDDNGDTNISRFHTLSGGNAQGDPSSEQVLIHQKQPYANHNGGGVVFGPDGYLWLSLGDGGSAGDPQGNGQNVNVLLGKLLRIDVVGKDTYTIPPDNPFANGGGRQEIFAWGLRNPWRFSFDRANGDLYIADVGQNMWEEIDYYPAGSSPGPNFGWNFFEGSHRFKGTPPEGVQMIPPVWEYSHSTGCSITGGFVYRGEQIPEIQGIYLYTDYCSGNVGGLLKSSSGEWQSQVLVTVKGNFSTIGQDGSGEIYLLDHGRGILYHLERK